MWPSERGCFFDLRGGFCSKGPSQICYLKWTRAFLAMRGLVGLSNELIRIPRRRWPAHAMLGYVKFLLTLTGARLSDHVLLQLEAVESLDENWSLDV